MSLFSLKCSDNVHFNKYCVDPEMGDSIAFQNQENWLMDRENKLYSELDQQERAIYAVGDQNETADQIETYENFVAQVNQLTELMLKFGYGNDGCRALACRYFYTKKKEGNLQEFMSDPGDDSDRTEYKNIATDEEQRVAPIGKAVRLQRIDRDNQADARGYRSEREDEKKLEVPKGDGL